MKQAFLNLINMMLSGMLVMLGFSSCSEGDNPEDIPLMYGSPHGSYKVSGLVTDVDGAPVKGARIVVRKYKADGQYLYFPNASDTTYTDNQGRYEREGGSGAEPSIRIVCDDPSGAYASDSTDCVLKYEGRDGMWDMGTAKVKADFKLRQNPDKE